MESLLLDAAGHGRSPATMPGYHEGRSPRNKGLRYPADPSRPHGACRPSHSPAKAKERPRDTSFASPQARKRSSA